MECDPLAPLHCAAAHGHLEIVKYLVEGKDGGSMPSALFLSLLHYH